jgi:general secretion pathway protein K
LSSPGSGGRSDDNLRPDEDGRRRGFALPLVLWLLAMLGLLGAQLASAVRLDIQIAGNLANAAHVAALLDAGLARAVHDLLRAQETGSGSILAGPIEYRLGGGTVVVTVRSESGRIQPSLASEGLMTALFEVAGVDPQQAQELAAAVADWGDADQEARPGGAEAADYRAAGANYVPPDGPFTTETELLQVRGMTVAILAAISPALSIYGGAAQPDPETAEPMVRAALALAGSRRGVRDDSAIGPHTPDSEPMQRADASRPAPGAQPRAPVLPGAESGGGVTSRTGEVPVLRLQLTARGAQSGVAERVTVVAIDRELPSGFRTFDWR